MTLTKSLTRLALITAGILLLPLVAMQFTPEVVWSPADFALAAALLFGTGLVYELVTRQDTTTTYRLAVGAALATGLLLWWSNLAVGLVGSGANPANLLYAGVPVVGIVGAIAARFRPQGMVYALLATAVAQVLVPAVAVLLWQQAIRVPEVAGLTAFFVALWLGAALLFRRASAGRANER